MCHLQLLESIEGHFLTGSNIDFIPYQILSFQSRNYLQESSGCLSCKFQNPLIKHITYNYACPVFVIVDIVFVEYIYRYIFALFIADRNQRQS
jgi:hypothetical protein